MVWCDGLQTDWKDLESAKSLSSYEFGLCVAGRLSACGGDQESMHVCVFHPRVMMNFRVTHTAATVAGVVWFVLISAVLWCWALGPAAFCAAAYAETCANQSQ